MARKWFVSQSERIYGPWSSEDVRAHLRDGNVSASDLIWGASQTDWQPLGAWDPQTSGAEDVGHNVPEDDTWHYAREGQSFGPYARGTLVLELRRLDSLEDVVLWTKGMTDWAPVFEFHDLLNDLGVDKRRYPRAVITGRAVLKYDGLTQIAALASISEGGCGLSLNSEIPAGTEVELELQGSSFRAPVYARAEVRYLNRGVLGLRFTSLASDGRGEIVTYVRQNSSRMAPSAA